MKLSYNSVRNFPTMLLQDFMVSTPVRLTNEIDLVNDYFDFDVYKDRSCLDGI